VEQAQKPEMKGQRVMLHGWANAIRRQKALAFVDLRDGTGFPAILQCVFAKPLVETKEIQGMHRETSLRVFGTLAPPAPGQKAPGDVELQVDWFEVVGESDGEIETRVNEESNVDTKADQRHLILREVETGYILKLRSHLMQALREHFTSKGWFEVTPPTIVQTQVEGGATLFEFNYFGEKAYLTQSSQLYLETVVPSLGKVFCMLPSFRAEKSRTRRHLAEFTHFEGEAAFITFEELLDILEDMVVDVAIRLQQRAGDMLKHVNPNFKVPERPFLRMNYTDAIKWLNDHGIKKEDGTPFEFGDDIPEMPERKMTDTIGKPIFLIRFPASLKSFYMQKDKDDPRLTESVDLLMPGVGEIIGGSMRSWRQEDLLAGFAREGINPEPYYWYTDLRKFGSCPHGGWGLGVERYLCWMLGLHHIRDVCLYPRYLGRATP